MSEDSAGTPSSGDTAPEGTVPVSAEPSTVLTEGTELSRRLGTLSEAVAAATGRVDAKTLTEAKALTDRAVSRLRLSSQHTVVALAGATGSGKSSTFNALTGLELSAVGVRRPTTSWATACVWGQSGAAELLEWLGIPERHQTTRDSMLDTKREGGDLDGVVLLDLPDHDSTEVAHHLEVDRLVVMADVIVWVLDPQKYADAAIHDKYLQPLRDHKDVMLVVLNHIDEVPEEKRDAMVADLQGILTKDGLDGVPVLPIAARLGWGIPELKQAIADRVADKKATAGRIDADITGFAKTFTTIIGDSTPATLEAGRVERLVDGLTAAAGAPVLVDAVRKSSKFKVRLPEGIEVAGGRVGDELRTLADELGGSLPGPWKKSLGTIANERQAPLISALNAALARLRESATRLSAWVLVLRVLPVVFGLGGVALGVWSAVLAGQGDLDEKRYTDPDWLSLGSGDLPLAWPLLAAIAAVVVALVLWLLLGIVQAVSKRRRATRVEQKIRGAVHTVALESAVTPLQNELISYKEFVAAVAKL